MARRERPTTAQPPDDPEPLEVLVVDDSALVQAAAQVDHRIGRRNFGSCWPPIPTKRSRCSASRSPA